MLWVTVEMNGRGIEDASDKLHSIILEEKQSAEL